jgi:ABC-2 type transport system permease protein
MPTMETALDLSRWREAPRGLSYRRGAMIWAGMRGLLVTRFFRILLVVAWVGGALIAALGFLFSQLVTPDGWLATYAVHFGPRFQAVSSVITAFVAMYPDIVVRGIFTTIFWFHSYLGLNLSLITLTVMVPSLITRDRASNALTVYLSRPLTSTDYLLGKLGIIVGLLALVWTGPLLFGWLLSMLFAPDRDFIIYSFTPLLRALFFNGVSLVVLAAIALGVSAIGRTARMTVTLWIGLWLFFGFIAAPPNMPSWLRRTSFSHDLGEIRQEVFKLDDVLGDAAAQLPLLDPQTTAKFSRASTKMQATDFNGAMVGLGIFCVAASFVFFRKLRPE